MRSAVIAGASGLVGGRCLYHLLEDPEIERVTALVRKPLPVTHSKLEQRTVTFAPGPDCLRPGLASAVRVNVGDSPTADCAPGRLPDVKDAVPKDIEDAYCALGTTMKKAGSREAFLTVDRDAVLGFAAACRTRGARRFVLVSSSRADCRSMNFYLRVKGEVERDVAALGFEIVHILRPSLLDGDRAESRPGERLALAVMRKVGALLGTGFRYAPIHVDIVGQAMVKLARSPQPGVSVHESPALHALLSDTRLMADKE